MPFPSSPGLFVAGDNLCERNSIPSLFRCSIELELGEAHTDLAQAVQQGVELGVEGLGVDGAMTHHEI